MAMYHLRVQFVKRSEGRSAVACAAYRAGDRLHDEREDKTHDYRRKQHVEHSEIMLPEGAPSELQDRERLWNAIEQGIKHPRGQPAMEVEFALPRELSREACLELTRRFAREQFVSQGVAVDLAIHRPQAGDGLDHPHVHLLIATRRFTDDGRIGKAARDMQDNPKLVQKVYALEEEGKLDEALTLQKDLNLGKWREAWAVYANRALEEWGSDARIDHRTLAAQEVAREPQISIGLTRYIREVRDGLWERMREFQAIGFRNAMRQQMDGIRKKRPKLLAEFIAKAREHGRKLFPELNMEPQGRGAGHER
ncbi:MAG: MobA/MobL family protein [Candidatus Competibacteraceae bacterium]|nr:MobA/MobL family protein [Candidatus Competibacteraceae bacterium]